MFSHQIKSFLWLLKSKLQQLFVSPPQNELRGREEEEEEEEEDKEEEPEHHGESQEQEESGRSIARSLRVSRVFVRAIEIDWWCRFF